MKAIALVFALMMTGVASAETSAPCKLPLYVEAAHGATQSTMDTTENLFLFGLKSAVMQHQGCIVEKMSDAQLGLYISTLQISVDGAPSDSSVVAVTLAVPLNGIPIYMDNYMLVIRSSENINGQVNELLENIGESLDRHSAPGQ